jgi:hypothetical protein
MEAMILRSVFHEVKHYLERADTTIGNLETTISPPEVGYSGYPRFRAPEQLLEALKYAGFDVLVTANNHSLDGLEFGVEYTWIKWTNTDCCIPVQPATRKKGTSI